MAISGKLILLRLNEALRSRDSSGNVQELFKLDSDDKLQMLKMPEISQDPSSANHLVRKAFIDAEFIVRDGKIEAIEQDVEALEQDMAVVQGDDATAGSIAKAKKDAIDYVNQKIADLVATSPELLNTLQELAEAIGSDPQFAQTIATQIGALDGRLDTVQGDALTSGSIAHAVAEERQRAENAENILDGRLDTAESEIDALQVAVSGLSSNAVITDLTNRVATVEQDMLDIDGYAQDIRDDLDNSLTPRVSAVEQAVQTLNGDSSVSGSVDQKVSAAISAVVNGAPEAFDTLKELADYVASDQTGTAAMLSQLSDHESRLDTLEAGSSVAGSVDYKVAQEASARQSAVSSEASARESADNALDARLDVVEALKKDVLTYESFTLDSSMLSSISVQHPIKGMPFVIREGVVGRPMRDFTFSGATITFAGEWANPSGVSKVEEGTELDVAYMYETDAFSSGSGGGGSGGGGSGGGGSGGGGGGSSDPYFALSANGQAIEMYNVAASTQYFFTFQLGATGSEIWSGPKQSGPVGTGNPSHNILFTMFNSSGNGSNFTNVGLTQVDEAYIAAIGWDAILNGQSGDYFLVADGPNYKILKLA